MTGRTGPPKTPTRVSQLRGNPGKRAINTREPKPAPASAEAPAWIADDSVALEEWTRLAPELSRLGLLTTVDVPALAAACRWWSLYRGADAALRAGVTGESRNNGRQAKPEFGIALKAYHAALEIFANFGVTPSARTRLITPEARDDSDPHEATLRRLEAKRSA